MRGFGPPGRRAAGPRRDGGETYCEAPVNRVVSSPDRSGRPGGGTGKRIRLSRPSTISDYAVGRATNDVLTATTAVWFKDEDEDEGERIGPVYLQVPGREELVPFAAAGDTEVEWHTLRVARDLGEMLGVEVISR